MVRYERSLLGPRYIISGPSWIIKICLLHVLKAIYHADRFLLSL